MRNIRLASLLMLLLCISIALQAQDSRLKKANQMFEEFSFPEAAEQYKKMLSKSDDIPEAKIQLAECYRLMNMPVEAEYWFEQVVDLPESEPVHKYYYGLSLKANGKFDQARQMFMEYAQLVPADSRGLRQVEACEQANYFLTDPGIYEVSLAANVNSEKGDFGPAFFKDGIVYASESNVKSSDQIYNWTEAPFLDLFYAEQDGDNASALGKPEIFKGKVTSWLHEGTVTFTEDNQTMYFTRNSYNKGKIGYDSEEKIKTVNLQIYRSKANGDKWGDVQGVSFNNDDYSVGHPALSSDGQALYFVSDMPGGYGMTDIYVSYKNGEDWGTPENLGPEINTEGEEMFPYIAKDGTLYFASDALAGLGGLDIFSSSYDDGIWTAPENLRYPINTNGDDFAFIIDETNEKGYFSSNRPGGKGNDDIYSFAKLKNVMTGVVVDCETQEPIEDALVELKENGVVMQKRTTNKKGGFTFPISPGKDYEVVASKMDYDEGLQEISTIGMSGTQIEVKIPICPEGKKNQCLVTGLIYNTTSDEPVAGAIVTLTNSETNEEKVFTTTEDGTYEFYLDPESNYVLQATKEYYFAKSKTITTVGRDCSDPLQKDLAIDIDLVEVTDGGKDPKLGLGPNNPNNGNGNNNNNTDYTPLPKPINITSGDLNQNAHILDLNHIYYDFDKAYIRKDAKEELNKVVSFMTDNPALVLELRSHTDARGTEEYNIELSERRAQSALEYILGRGIATNRISARGFGESEPANQCVDHTTCEDPEHQDNRRTEFWIIGIREGGAQRSLPRYFYKTDHNRGKNYYKDGVSSSYSNGNDNNSYAADSHVGHNHNEHTNTAATSTTDYYDQYNTTGTVPTDIEETHTETTHVAPTIPDYDNDTPTFYDTSEAAPPASLVASNTDGSLSSAEYKVQLGVYGSPDMTQFNALVDLGLVDVEEANESSKRVLIGTFYDKTSADNVLYQAKQRGFEDAFVVKYQNGLRVGR
ncbi:MAG: carboxypeptidase regulatory-like domain-containing protein [Chitinophagales bacterium]